MSEPFPQSSGAAGDHAEVLSLLGRAIHEAPDQLVRVGGHEVPAGRLQEHVLRTLDDHARHAIRTGASPEPLTWRGIGIRFEYRTPPAPNAKLGTEPDASESRSLPHNAGGLTAVLSAAGRELRLPLLTPERVGVDFDMHVYAKITATMEQAELAALGVDGTKLSQRRVPPEQAVTEDAGRSWEQWEQAALDAVRRKRKLIESIQGHAGHGPELPTTPLSDDERDRFEVLALATKTAALGLGIPAARSARCAAVLKDAGASALARLIPDLDDAGVLFTGASFASTGFRGHVQASEGAFDAFDQALASAAVRHGIAQASRLEPFERRYLWNWVDAAARLVVATDRQGLPRYDGDLTEVAAAYAQMTDEQLIAQSWVIQTVRDVPDFDVDGTTIDEGLVDQMMHRYEDLIDEACARRYLDPRGGEPIAGSPANLAHPEPLDRVREGTRVRVDTGQGDFITGVLERSRREWWVKGTRQPGDERDQIPLPDNRYGHVFVEVLTASQDEQAARNRARAVAADFPLSLSDRLKQSARPDSPGASPPRSGVTRPPDHER